MSDVKWIKIATDIFDDEKIMLIEAMPEADAIIVIWFKLLCMAGKQNNSGVFMLNDRIAYTDEMLAAIFRRNIATVRLALQTFEQFGMVEIVNNTVTIPNWGKYQRLDAVDARTEYQRNYMRAYRARQKQLAASETGTDDTAEDESCKPNSEHNVSTTLARQNKNKNKIYTPPIIPPKGRKTNMDDFDTFWAAYPRRVAKQNALKAWTKINPDSELLNRILGDVNRRNLGEWRDKEPQYIPHPATYLNQRRWEDECATGGDSSHATARNDISPEEQRKREDEFNVVYFAELKRQRDNGEKPDDNKAFNAALNIIAQRKAAGSNT